jgi:RNA polymerase sigma factor (sigma-70 family)
MILQDRTGTRAADSMVSSPGVQGGARSARRGAASLGGEWSDGGPGEGRRMTEGEGSITHHLGGLRVGDEAAVRAVLERYLDPLEAYARRLLRGLGASRAVADEQDLAQQAILIVVVGIRDEKYKDLHDRHALNRLLWTVTRRQAMKLKRSQQAVRRTGGVRAASIAAAPAGTGNAGPVPGARRSGAAGEPPPDPGPGRDARRVWEPEELITRVLGRKRPAEEVIAIREEIRAVFDALEDERDRDILRLKLEGYTHAEIAARLGCCERTVSLRFQRVCGTIRKLADDQAPPFG